MTSSTLDYLESERLKLSSQLDRIAKHIHYPECWDTVAYPTLADAVCEITYCDPEQCTHNRADLA